MEKRALIIIQSLQPRKSRERTGRRSQNHLLRLGGFLDDIVEHPIMGKEMASFHSRGAVKSPGLAWARAWTYEKGDSSFRRRAGVT
jgi:hypothetical protein